LLVFHRAQLGRGGRPHEDHIAAASTDLVNRDLCSDKKRLDGFVVERLGRKELMPDVSVMLAQASIV
jgi:hypothetical protein